MTTFLLALWMSLFPLRTAGGDHSPPMAASLPLVIVGATRIDTATGQLIADSVLIVENGRIKAAGTSADTPIPQGATVVHAEGKWLMPGLIDCHVHLDEDISPGAFVLFGVTSVRDVGSRLVTIQQLRARAAQGETLPRIFWMGRNIDEGKPSWWGAVAVKNASGVPALLSDMATQGVDGVKLYVAAGPDVTKAVIQAAHQRGWPVTAHLQATAPSVAAQAGIDNLEHISTLFEELRDRSASAPAGFGKGFAGVANLPMDGPRVTRLTKIYAQSRVAITPTLAVATMPVEGEAGADRVYKGWAEVPKGWRTYWKTPYWDFIATKKWRAGDFQTARLAFAKFKEWVALLDRSGVPIVAGTDSPAPWTLPGAGLVHELELLVEAGLSPLSAIQAATFRAARVLHKQNEVGTLAAGAQADFLLLDSNPLKNIAALRHLNAVYVSGKPVNLAQLRSQFNQAHAVPGASH